ncbi:DUF4062 domain-containing protein [Streptomyces sp. NPDC102451]|uniref:DUF4062 domain-containing protein n=1 Tax=Streptomyces sp. NPDC102451 TaxID=3366177 RepID=UPI0037F85C51
MAANIREVVVFIASPGDVQGEREAVRMAADSLNNLHSAVSAVRVRVTGWEHVQPEHERPQEVINELVDECDIFIGVLHRKWGSPTGQYDSGFEEEYERALGRRKATGSPEMPIYFKRVEQDFLVDPGEHLKKVLKFQRRFQEEHSALYREFASLEDFKLKIYTYLNSLIVSKLKSVESNGGGEGNAATLPLPPAGVTHMEKKSDPARKEILSTFSAFSDLAVEGKASSALDRDRLLMVALAFQPEMVSIPMHALNRLYGRRAELHLSAMEYRTMIWTLADSYGRAAREAPNVATPVWYFLDSRSNDGIRDLLDVLVSLAFDEHDDFVVRCGAFRILSFIAARPIQLWASEKEVGVSEASLTPASYPEMDATPIGRWELHLNSKDSIGLALDYMAEVAGIQDVSFIRELSLRVESSSTRLRLQAIANYLSDDFDGLTLLATSHVSSGSWEEKFLLQKIGLATDEQLLQLIGARNIPIQINLAAVETISAARALSSEEISRALKRDNDALTNAVFEAVSRSATAEAKLAVLEAIAALGNSNFAGEYKPQLLALAHSSEELRKLATDPHRAIDAWPALALVESADALAVEARSILDTDCASHIDVERLEEFGYKGSILAFVRAKVRCAALRVLEQLGESHKEHDADVQRVRAELEKRHLVTQEIAARILVNWGSEDDALEIVAVAEIVRDQELISGAIKLGGIRIARHCLKSEDSWKATLSAAVLVECHSIEYRELLECMYSDHAKVRFRAVLELRRRFNDERLEEFIDIYRGRSNGYYYDVVAAIDRMLYAPLPLAEYVEVAGS